MVVVEILFVTSLLGAASALPYQSVSALDDGSYQFFYETGDDAGNQMRSERRGPDGVVTGSYGYRDPTGEHRVVNYRADDDGYVAQGDVSVPGAPEGQLPPEPQDFRPGNMEPENIRSSTTEPEDDKADSTEPKKPDDDAQEKKRHDLKKDETKSHEDEDDESDDSYEDDVKPVKLPEPTDDLPPEGFPVGFFTHQFQNVRRLGDPKSEELKRRDDEDDAKAEDDSTKESDKKDTAPQHIPVGPVIPQHLPTQHFVHPHPAWATGAGPVQYSHGFNHPVSYVYSYNHPQAHGYYYFY